MQKAQVQVTAFDGKILGTKAIPKTGKGQVKIKKKNYPAGTYFYSLMLDEQVVKTKKMVLVGYLLPAPLARL
ncbi:MAG: hypothetical protein AB8G86_22240 [Saprospiraceae bacterium]